MRTASRHFFYLLLLAGITSASAQNMPLIYQWIDEQGHTHYGDRPPLDTPVRELDPSQLQLSTIGGTALRDGEQDLLEHYHQEAQARREQAAQQASAAPPAVVVVNPPPEPVIEKRVIWPVWWRPAYKNRYRQHHHSAWHMNLNVHWGKGKKHRPPDKPSSIKPLKPAPAKKPTHRIAASIAAPARTNPPRPPLYPLPR